MHSLVRVFRTPRSWGVAFISALLVFLIATLASNAMLIWQFVFQSDASLLSKGKLLWYLSGSIGTNFLPLAVAYTVLISILVGINVALFLFYVRTRQRKGGLAGGVGVGGFLSGLLGLGCAACGSALILPLLSLVGASGLFALLPLHGQEFGLFGVALLLFSAILLLRRISDPLVCPLE